MNSSSFLLDIAGLLSHTLALITSCSTCISNTARSPVGSLFEKSFHVFVKGTLEFAPFSIKTKPPISYVRGLP